MTKQELISKGKTKVRNTPSLLLIYIDLYREQLGYKPACAGCTFNSDWDKFVRGEKSSARAARQPKQTPVTFRLKSRGSEIFRFEAHGKTFLRYSNRLTEDFAINFLTYGTEEQISERRKKFDVLPEKLR